MFGLSLESIPLLLAAAGGALVLFLGTRRYPRVGFVIWLLTLVLVPVWFGPTLIVTFQPASAVGVIVVAAFAARWPRQFGVADLLVVFFFIACVAPLAIGGATPTTVFTVVAVWGVGYVLGRIAPLSVELPWVYSAVAVVFTGIAALSVLEFVMDWHVYSQLGRPNALFAEYGQVQIRGDRARSEWSFGHSIALGASIAMAVPMAIVSSFGRLTRLVMLGVMLAGVAVTFSRIGIAAALLGAALTLALVRSPRVREIRGAAVVVLLVGLAAAVPAIQGVFLEAGEEATLSAQYRGRLLDLVPEIEILGFSGIAGSSSTGRLVFGEFASLDSQLLLLGLSYGALAVGLSFVLLILGAGAVISGRSTAAVVAVVAQVPGLMTVALITQYAVWFWFVAGLAVASVVPTLAGADAGQDTDTDHDTAARGQGAPVHRRVMAGGG